MKFDRLVSFFQSFLYEQGICSYMSFYVIVWSCNIHSGYDMWQKMQENLILRDEYCKRRCKTNIKRTSSLTFKRRKRAYVVGGMDKYIIHLYFPSKFSKFHVLSLFLLFLSNKMLYQTISVKQISI